MYCQKIHEFRQNSSLPSTIVLKDLEITREPIRRSSVERPGTPATWDEWQHRFAREREMMQRHMLRGISEE